LIFDLYCIIKSWSVCPFQLW